MDRAPCALWNWIAITVQHTGREVAGSSPAVAPIIRFDRIIRHRPTY